MNKKATRMVEVLRRWHCPQNLKNQAGIEDLIQDVYNEAMKDVSDFIDVMIDKNPAHRNVLIALKVEMFPGLTLDDATK